MEHLGSGYSQVPDCFDTRSDVMLIPSSLSVVYDAHLNRWEKIAARSNTIPTTIILGGVFYLLQVAIL